MRTETRLTYIAFDNREFHTEAECRAHERAQSGERLVGLTETDIQAALSGADRELGDAIETVARKIAQARIERGDLKRPRRASQASPKPTSAPTQEGAAQ